MGMYTGLRMKVYVKEEYREMIGDISNHEKDWDEFIHEFPFISLFAEYDRSSFIPGGSLCYMPESWCTRDDENLVDVVHDGFETSFSEDTGYWTFACSLKNYESEIEVFLSRVASVIVDSTKEQYIETLYEESRYGVLYKVEENGAVAQVGSNRYTDDELYGEEW
ncbi:hypothetical protein vBBceHLY2_00058 [Bacillus phage vB_BceH_LY2]|nr:hypothetical protein vBBceHLY2_00058 [Bacillus phage vB_BceH_LY2]